MIIKKIKMTKKIAYLPLESFKSLIPLLLKLIQSRKDIVILVQKAEKILEISEFLWRSHKFIPHGIEGEEFAHLQPIIISCKPLDRSIAIIIDGDEKINFAGESIILWDKKPKDKEFMVYQELSDLSWERVF